MKKYIICSLFLLFICCLTACSNEKLNELLFVNKIISLIELEDNGNIEVENSNIPINPSNNNPFISDDEEGINLEDVSLNDTFLYLDWISGYGINTDLDLMVLLVNNKGKAEQTNLINYNNFNYTEDVAVHMGDSELDNECIYLNLDNIPEEIAKIYIYCYNYSNEWDTLSKLRFRVDSLNEKFETDIRVGNINAVDVQSEFGSGNYNTSEDNSVGKSEILTSAIELGVYERRGPIWYLSKDTKEILDLNKELGKYGIYTQDYSSAYLDEQARLESERIEQERLEVERIEQERLEQERLEAERIEIEKLEENEASEEIIDNIDIVSGDESINIEDDIAP